MSLIRELKLAVRHLSKSPGFVTLAVLMLALGIGATTAIFSIVEGVLLRPLPFPQSNRLMVVSDILQGADLGGNQEAGVTAQDIVNYTRNMRSFSSLGAFQLLGYELSGLGEPAALTGTRMTAGVFPALGVAPLLGRVFTQQEDDRHEPVVVLSYATWQDRFHGEAGILGRKILLDRQPYVVIGVMPRDFEFPLVPGGVHGSEVWVPFSLTAEELSAVSAANWAFNMVGRLKPGVSVQQAAGDAARVAAETVRNYPSFMAGLSIRPVVRPLEEETVEQARPLIRTLFLAVVVVLLIACANLAGLLLVRAIRRRREIAVRLALGATAATLLRQAVLESLVLSVAGGVAGLLLAAVGLKTGLSLLPRTLPRLNEIGLDWPVAGFALALAGVTGLLCGLAPAFAAIRTNVNDTLKEGGRTGTSGSGHARLRSALVIAEIAVALVLLAASGLLLRSFEKMREIDPGFRPDHTLVAAYNLPKARYATQAAVAEFDRELLQGLQQLPGTKSAGLTALLPDAGEDATGSIIAEGYVPPTPDSIDLATSVQIDGDYLQAMGIPLLRGRLLTPADDENGPLSILVNRKLAEQSWPGQDPIGKRLRVGTTAMKTPWATVVGEVADVKEDSPDQPSKQQYYVRNAQLKRLAGELMTSAYLFGSSGYIAVRTAIPPEMMENALRATVRSMDAQLSLVNVQTMEQALAKTEMPRRFNTGLISAFAATAVLLAVLGIYSVMAFSVAQRMQEIAIRMALGAKRTGIVGLVLASGLKLAIAGCVLGLLGSVAASRLLGSLLFGVSAMDPVVLALASLVVLLLAIGACMLPAHRAASVDPTRALRAE